jgi:ferredoxin
MIRVEQLRRKCIGCNACVEIAPYRWRVSKKDGKCTLIGGSVKKDIYSVNVDEDELDDLKMAAKNCPVKIIRVQAKN